MVLRRFLKSVPPVSQVPSRPLGYLCRALVPSSTFPNSELRTPNSELRTPNSEPPTPNSELPTPTPERPPPNPKPRTPTSELRTPNSPPFFKTLPATVRERPEQVSPVH